MKSRTEVLNLLVLNFASGAVAFLLGSAPVCGVNAAETDRPSHAEALVQMRRFFDDHEKESGIDSVTNVKYVNGYQEDANRYVVVATYTRVFKVGVRDIADGVASFAVLYLSIGEFEAGDSIDEVESFHFLRTENGWILTGGDGGTIQARHFTHPHESAPAKPFSANAVLNGDMSSTKCRVPKGTRVMDLGHSFAYSESYPKDSVVIDPAVCASTTLNVPVELIDVLPGSEGELANLREPKLVPSEAFTSNAVLTRDFEVKAFEGTCMLAKGTGIRDLGPLENWQKIYREPMERIALPPGSCTNLGSNHKWALPAGVLESQRVEASSSKVASRQQPLGTAQSSTPSFNPNGRLLRDWRFGNCAIPRGTRLMDLGHAIGVPDATPMESVIVDPAAICSPGRGSGMPIYMSKSAIGAID